MWYLSQTCLFYCANMLYYGLIFFMLTLTDWATKDQPELSAGSVESVQTGFRGDQWLPDGGKVLCVSFPPPHGIPGGCSAASAKSAGILKRRSL